MKKISVLLFLSLFDFAPCTCSESEPTRFKGEKERRPVTIETLEEEIGQEPIHESAKQPIEIILPEKKFSVPGDNLEIIKTSNLMYQLYRQHGFIKLALSQSYFDTVYSYMGFIANQGKQAAKQTLAQLLGSKSILEISSLINLASYLDIEPLLEVSLEAFTESINKKETLELVLNDPKLLQQLNITPDAKELLAQRMRTKISGMPPFEKTFRKSLNASKEPIDKIVFDKSGTHMASCGAFELVLWNIQNMTPDILRFQPTIWDDQNKLIVTLPDELVGLLAQFSPDGSKLAATSKNSTVIVWDIKQKSWQEVYGHSDIITSLAFNMDGTQIASASMDRTVQIATIKPGQRLQKLTTLEQKEPFSSIAFSHDGSTIAACNWSSSVQLFDAQTAKLTETLENPAPITSVQFSGTGKYLLARSDRAIYAWDFNTKKRVYEFSHSISIDDSALNNTGTLLATASRDTLRIWDIATGKEIKAFNLKSQHYVKVAFAPNAKTLATSDGKTVTLWDIDSKTYAQKIQLTKPVSTLAFHPVDGRLFVSQGSSIRVINLWSIPLNFEELFLIWTLTALAKKSLISELESYPHLQTQVNRLKDPVQKLIKEIIEGKK